MDFLFILLDVVCVCVIRVCVYVCLLITTRQKSVQNVHDEFLIV